MTTMRAMAVILRNIQIAEICNMMRMILAVRMLATNQVNSAFDSHKEKRKNEQVTDKRLGHNVSVYAVLIGSARISLSARRIT